MWIWISFAQEEFVGWSHLSTQRKHSFVLIFCLKLWKFRVKWIYFIFVYFLELSWVEWSCSWQMSFVVFNLLLLRWWKRYQRMNSCFKKKNNFWFFCCRHVKKHIFNNNEEKCENMLKKWMISVKMSAKKGKKFQYSVWFSI